MNTIFNHYLASYFLLIMAYFIRVTSFLPGYYPYFTAIFYAIFYQLDLVTLFDAYSKC